jgi:hypothetical protein
MFGFDSQQGQVADVAPKKASLLEPGNQAAAEPLKVRPDFLLAIDFAPLRAEATIR